MKFPTGDSYVLVLDIETTSLDETAPHAAILEVGAVLCRDTPDLPVIAEANMIIRPPGDPGTHDAIWASMDMVNRDMLIDSGLWQEATDPARLAWQSFVVDGELVGWIDRHAGRLASVVLAGSGVSHFDQRWLRAHLPMVYCRLMYWTLDAGVFRRMLDYAGRDDLIDLAGDVDAKPHRALPDARMHRLEMVRYIGLLASLERA